VTAQESAPAAESPSSSSSSPFELRWRLFGIRFRIGPSFWIFSAIMGFLVMQAEQSMRQQALSTQTMLLRVLFWVLCTFASVLVHELGHVIVGRIFGQPGDIALYGMGGQAAGKYEKLTSWQRIFVAAAGPGAGFLFLGAQVALDSHNWNLFMDYFNLQSMKVELNLINKITDNVWRMNSPNFRIIMGFLFLMNLFWNVLNLLPIFPMDGGMIVREIFVMIFPTNGLKLTYGFSFFLAGLVVVYSLVKLFVPSADAPRDQFSRILDMIWLVTFGMLALQNFFALWQETLAQRSAQYQNRFDD
jgi:stage IV sporulation protein FB